QNATLWDAEGRRFIDFAAGIAVLNTGHRHPRVMAAVQEQLDCFTHTAFQIVPYESAVRLAERINALAPFDTAAKTAFFTTGAEAVENAVKIARAHTGRTAVLAFGGAFHGRTMMGLALTGKVKPYKAGFGPFPAEVYHVPFPSAIQGVTQEQSLAAIDALFANDVEPSRVAAIIIEPVQGEGGFHVAPPTFLRRLRKICDDFGIVLIADEIQTGFGRTGHWFAVQHAGVSPDLVALAKGLAGGFPLSAVCGRSEVMDAPQPGGLGGTYAASPMGVAAANAVIDVISQEGLCMRALQLGERLVNHLAALRGELPAIAEIRALGSMVALELRDPSTGSPDAQRTRRVQQLALEDGLLLLSCGQAGNVLRFLYPLTIEDDVFDSGLGKLAAALREGAR
ncbi:MAG: 4-aminobutyrate--2-oxoglutarate transaminase, partial [Burkholderiaceae bacterium]|nr:4-aminobutyrate--2-oxoglutarate transaminase [Burkholderiaceae bacterium]